MCHKMHNRWTAINPYTVILYDTFKSLACTSKCDTSVALMSHDEKARATMKNEKSAINPYDIRLRRISIFKSEKRAKNEARQRKRKREK